MASHLISHEKGEVAFIDTTGTFSPLRLRDVLASRLQQQSRRRRYQQLGYMYEKVPPESDATQREAIETATSMLDRVKVMRVFDFAGVVEAIGEVGEMWEAVLQARENTKIREAQNVDAVKGVADSEEEAEEMLDDLPSLQSPSLEAHGPTTSDEAGQIGIIVVDTTTNVVSSMMSKSQVQGTPAFCPHPTQSH